MTQALPLELIEAKPKRGAQPPKLIKLLGAAKPRPTSGGKAEPMLARDPWGPDMRKMEN